MELLIFILHSGGEKTAGIIRFDVADLANEGIKTKMMESKIEKCPDKNARLKFQLRVHPLGDFTDLEPFQEE